MCGISSPTSDCSMSKATSSSAACCRNRSTWRPSRVPKYAPTTPDVTKTTTKTEVHLPTYLRKEIPTYLPTRFQVCIIRNRRERAKLRYKIQIYKIQKIFVLVYQ